MIGTHGSYRAGAALVDPQMPSMDTSYGYGQQLVYNNEWSDDYFESMSKHGDIARPIIYKSKSNKIIPCYNGNLRPTPEAHKILFNEDIIFCPRTKKYYKVCSDNLREPSYSEYKNYFKKSVNNGDYKISSSKLKKFGMSLVYIKGFRIHKIAGEKPCS